jgi:GntR family transcriptional regulator
LDSVEWLNSEFSSREPIYQQIIQQFGFALASGKAAPSQRLPSIRDLSVGLKVNANTVQRAYQEMERRGWIYSMRGTGYFVVEGAEGMLSAKESLAAEATETFCRSMASLGFEGSAIVAWLQAYIKEGPEKGEEN